MDTSSIRSLSNSSTASSIANHNGGIPSRQSSLSFENDSSSITNSIGTVPSLVQLSDRDEHDHFRAVHRIRLAALRHNYACVESAANRQRCSVIAVVKADGYGHGALETAVHLADYCGADAFAVATLEEAIALRKAFDVTAPGKTVASTGLIKPKAQTRPAVTAGGGAAAKGPKQQQRTQARKPQAGEKPDEEASAPPTSALAVLSGTVGQTKNVAELFTAPPPSIVAAGPSGAVSPPRSASPPPPGLVTVSAPPSAAAPCTTSPPNSATAGTANVKPARPVPTPSRRPITSAVSAPVPRASSVISTASTSSVPPRLMRPARIRILVLGPPVGYPRCFDLYHHHNIELMVSGPEAARALMHWIEDVDERRRMEVERAAAEAKEAALSASHHGVVSVAAVGRVRRNALEDDEDDEVEEEDECEGESKKEAEKGDYMGIIKNVGEKVEAVANGDKSPVDKATPSSKRNSVNSKAAAATTVTAAQLQNQMQAVTLSNVSGANLAKEVRAILMSQQAQQAAAALGHLGPPSDAASAPGSGTATPSTGGDPGSKPGVKPVCASSGLPGGKNAAGAGGGVATGKSTTTVPAPPVGTGAPFRGIEDVAMTSRLRELAAARAAAAAAGDDGAESDQENLGKAGGVTGDWTVPKKPVIPSVPPVPARKKLRWHALVDSGMGRLGFKTDYEDDTDEVKMDSGDGAVSSASGGKNEEDSLAIIKALHDLEVHSGAPVEFYGMCTHMADASSSSDYTKRQMKRFLSLLNRVRKAGIFVSTVSTDNSAALLSTKLDHFDPAIILSQPNADTRGFVRTGGAIYGQRPSFPQLRAVSTLMASVRHVAVLKKGESVGYDRAYIAPMDVRIATITVGFADGYPRDLGNGVGKVSIRGAVFPVAGNVCMDMTMVELGPAEDRDGVGSRVVVGDVAILWGPEGNCEDAGDGLVRLRDVAQTLKTTQSALTCGLNKIRVQRQYV